MLSPVTDPLMRHIFIWKTSAVFCLGGGQAYVPVSKKGGGQGFVFEFCDSQNILRLQKKTRKEARA